jgi:hypothetical protein
MTRAMDLLRLSKRSRHLSPYQPKSLCEVGDRCRTPPRPLSVWPRVSREPAVAVIRQRCNNGSYRNAKIATQSQMAG